MAVKSKTTIVTRSEVRWKGVAIGILSVLSIIVILPAYLNRGIDWVNARANIGVPRFGDKGFNLGLDLQGGAHLIYHTRTDHIAEADKKDAVEGVRDVIERRVRGGLGVAEPLVQTTQVGNDYRIIVELPGVASTTQAIEMIGKTPVLEFKEENNEPARELTVEEKKQMDSYNAQARKKATEALRAVQKRGADFAMVVKKYSEDEQSKEQGGDLGFLAYDQAPELFDWAKNHKDGEVSKDLVKSDFGFHVVKRLEAKEGEKMVAAAHILICYVGTTGCENAQYTKEQAKAKIEELKKEVTVKNFADYATQYSTEPAAKQTGGNLSSIKKDQAGWDKDFINAVWDVPVGNIIGPVETQYGYHLIYKKGEENEKLIHLSHLFVKTKQKTDIVPPTETFKNTGLSGKQLKKAEVVQDPNTGEIQVSLRFDDEGAKLFADITARNIGKQIAIVLDNTVVSNPNVPYAITSGSAVISGKNMTYQDARELAQNLNSGALPVPVELISQQKVDATLGGDSLQKSFKAGLIGLLLVMVFMTLYYRLPGLLSVVSLAVYTIVTLAIFKLIGVTLTLAGIAGFILSIGMAVDANVLVFERLKEELRAGKSLPFAMEESFIRAWPSIRDGHITTLISCFLLMWFSTGFIRGFAVVLATGVLMSLFTAITVTRTAMRLTFPLFTGRVQWLFLGSRKEQKV